MLQTFARQERCGFYLTSRAWSPSALDATSNPLETEGSVPSGLPRCISPFRDEEHFHLQPYTTQVVVVHYLDQLQMNPQSSGMAIRRVMTSRLSR